MSYSVTFEPESITDLDLITDLIRLRILNKIEWLAINFEQITPLPLTREWSGFYKLRVGDYRVIYEFDRESRIIIIIRVGHRSEVYD
ncbi:MAG: type II toxin-antitoxin system RelE/ParE family toxin [Microcystis aeruginosa Ma_QC_Ch_20071001_S25]|jgi:mRNA interferase RelE/StbE|uniref:Type II toxin-antitoxin system RelE/ParE family toxin n=4 Tax=Microcystis TaxID=1125 RepID=A0A552F5E2_MICAE|nr:MULTISPECIES: type II toxin-antitoxin system RelE/ParE family toxin [unclassified Microcystis]MCA2763887.1 type II toxin-antitoxin system RelE/ParE family toxin [Microcystis sp. M151S2]NCQ83989.1 type II toxin-antitoxin system RelE/ParE family toxin [Microcystis aeruginosa W13-18]NCR34539.1 type II toxin-antitoxin system RelE/ParE family toxin [Microcystis aeruginosa S11-05]NCR47997.1 type II toxin-antitoxin system RelE/ParE family toxin [Microcystis aeruginosa S11-01]NCR57924.1 type II tox